jgi:[ribosomal protein S18]-alanine N-acetyltransferase
VWTLLDPKEHVKMKAIHMETHSSFSLRPCNLDDLEKVYEIELRTQIAPWTMHQFQTEFDKPYSQFLLLTDDETDQIIAGYILFWNLFEEGQILTISVDLPFRRKGLAEKMLRKMIQLTELNKIKKILLDVRKSNTPAIQLYQKIGFSITHIRKEFYSNGEDAYLMIYNTKEIVN